MAKVLSEVFSLKTGWIVGYIEDHVARPMTQPEVDAHVAEVAALRLALKTATRERDDIAAWAESWTKRVAAAERERDEARDRIASLESTLKYLGCTKRPAPPADAGVTPIDSIVGGRDEQDTNTGSAVEGKERRAVEADAGAGRTQEVPEVPAQGRCEVAPAGRVDERADLPVLRRVVAAPPADAATEAE